MPVDGPSIGTRRPRSPSAGSEARRVRPKLSNDDAPSNRGTSLALSHILIDPQSHPLYQCNLSQVVQSAFPEHKLRDDLATPLEDLKKRMRKQAAGEVWETQAVDAIARLDQEWRYGFAELAAERLVDEQELGTALKRMISSFERRNRSHVDRARLQAVMGEALIRDACETHVADASTGSGSANAASPGTGQHAGKSTGENQAKANESEAETSAQYSEEDEDESTDDKAQVPADDLTSALPKESRAVWAMELLANLHADQPDHTDLGDIFQKPRHIFQAACVYGDLRRDRPDIILRLQVSLNEADQSYIVAKNLAAFETWQSPSPIPPAIWGKRWQEVMGGDTRYLQRLAGCHSGSEGGREEEEHEDDEEEEDDEDEDLDSSDCGGDEGYRSSERGDLRPLPSSEAKAEEDTFRPSPRFVPFRRPEDLSKAVMFRYHGKVSKIACSTAFGGLRIKKMGTLRGDCRWAMFDELGSAAQVTGRTLDINGQRTVVQPYNVEEPVAFDSSVLPLSSTFDDLWTAFQRDSKGKHAQLKFLGSGKWRLTFAESPGLYSFQTPIPFHEGVGYFFASFSAAR